MKDPNDATTIALFVECAEGAEYDEEALLGVLRLRLPDWARQQTHPSSLPRPIFPDITTPALCSSVLERSKILRRFGALKYECCGLPCGESAVNVNACCAAGRADVHPLPGEAAGQRQRQGRALGPAPRRELLFWV